MRDPDTGWVQLSDVEFTVLWSALGLGEPPVALRLTRLGRTARRRAQLAAEVSRALDARGLGTLERPARDLGILLRLLAAPEVSLDLWVEGDGEPLAGIAAADRRGAAAVAKVGDEIRLGPVQRERLAASLLNSLSPIPAGPGRPANIGFADYQRACAEGERDGHSGFLAVLGQSGLRQPEITTITKAITGRVAGGRLGATGRAGRAPVVVTWLDTAEGRYVLRRNGSWLTVTPADPARLSAIAEDLLADAR